MTVLNVWMATTFMTKEVVLDWWLGCSDDQAHKTIWSPRHIENQDEKILTLNRLFWITEFLTNGINTRTMH